MNLSIETLPVELLYHILDNLDAKTIVFSIRPVCRLFRSVVNTYNRYNLDLTLISRWKFYVLCRLINPTNVISLTLSNDERTADQINLFFSLVRLREFNRLRFITLLNIDELQLNFILKRVNVNFLTSFLFTIRKYDNNRQEITNNLLTSIITQSSLRKLEFNINNNRLSILLWPINCTIQYLTINECINMDNLFTILQYCRHLQTLNVKKIVGKIFANIIPITFEQLTSLSIEEFNGIMGQLELFLLMTPSLVYLKVIDGKQISDGQRWEQFIERNLQQLKTFEFFFEELNMVRKSSEEVQLILASFQTPFWIKKKKWFVICEYEITHSRVISLYSIPLCKSYMHYEIKSENVLSSLHTATINDEPLIMDHVSSLFIDLDQKLVDHIQGKKAMINHCLFPKVTKIDIQFSQYWPMPSFQLFNVFIEISRITQIKLSTYCFSDSNENRFIDIGIFIQQAHNLSSLMFSSKYITNYILIPDAIYSIVPSYIKHLQIPVKYLYQVKMVIERCQDLSIVQFDTKTHSTLLEDVVKWFADNTVNSTCQKHDTNVIIWMGKKRIQLIETRDNYKRIKLTENC